MRSLRCPSEKFLKENQIMLDELPSFYKYSYLSFLESIKKSLILDLDETLIHTCKLPHEKIDKIISFNS